MNSRLKVALIEDQADDAFLIQNHLRENLPAQIQCIWYETLESALPELSSQTFDLVLTDLSLPGQMGLEALFQIKKAVPQIPIVVLTGNHNPELGLESLKAGAQDYLHKEQINPHILNKTITYAIERQHLQSQLQAAALHDTMTQLPNRTLFQDRLERALERAKRYQRYQFAILFIDLDRFKKINDSLGHLIGDQLLIQVSRRLQRCIRSGDTVARLGGDEFVVLLDEVSEKSEIFRVTERILKSLSLSFNLEGHLINSSCSIGVALSSSGYKHPAEMLRDADIAMYQAKTQGRNNYVIFDPQMHEKIQSLIALEKDMLKALENQNFRVYYQPIIHVDTGVLAGFEALIRWQHPEKGLLTPRSFLKVAQDTGLLVPMSYWALQQACKQLYTWQNQFNQPWKMHVNIASQQFSIPDFQEQIGMILELSELDPSFLVLELTEDVLHKDEDTHLKAMKHLKDMGLNLYLDDFGTAYSSISSLYNFPIDALKIDLRVTHATQNPRLNSKHSDLDFIKAMVAMARHMGLEFGIEGVETETQLALLQQEQCPFAQGYYFSPPLPADAMTKLLLQEPNWLKGKLEAPILLP